MADTTCVPTFIERGTAMTSIHQLALTKGEASEVRALLDGLSTDPKLTEQYALLDQAHVLSHGLPSRVRRTFYEFKRYEKDSVLYVTGSPVLAEGPGPTPTTYVEEQPGFKLNDAQILHALYGSLLGEAIGYTSQRGGSCFNSIVPIPDLAEIPNSSSGSAHDFGFHIEDAFHPTRPDFLGLACMRNDEKAGTTVSSIDGVAEVLNADEIEFLFEPRFKIGHNPIHYTTGVVIEERQPVFFGRKDRPYVRVNFAALDWSALMGWERAVLTKLLAHFEARKVTLTLGSGDYVYVNNYTTAHARDAYQPLPPGESRWLSRLCFASDLRQSSARRESVTSRAISA